MYYKYILKIPWDSTQKLIHDVFWATQYTAICNTMSYEITAKWQPNSYMDGNVIPIKHVSWSKFKYLMVLAEISNMGLTQRRQWELTLVASYPQVDRTKYNGSAVEVACKQQRRGLSSTYIKHRCHSHSILMYNWYPRTQKRKLKSRNYSISFVVAKPPDQTINIQWSIWKSE